MDLRRGHSESIRNSLGKEHGKEKRRRITLPVAALANLRLTRSLLFIHHHSSGRLSQFQLGAHLLNLRGLVFYCCRETRNRGFQFRDPLLLLLEFIECRLVLGALRSCVFSPSAHWH